MGKKNLPPTVQFPGVTAPSTDFAALLNGQRSLVRVREIDLSVARTAAAPLLEKLAGNAFFIDQASDVGNATVIFEGVPDNTQAPIMAAMYVGPGFVAKVPFCNLAIYNTAQAGKKLRIFYGTDIDFTPAISNTISINTLPTGYTYGADYKSATALGALGTDTVFAPAANVNGAIVWACQIVTSSAGQNVGAFIAKSGAPASLIDGDPICYGNANAAGNYSFPFAMPNPVKIPAGLGLYYISQQAETGAFRFCQYTLL